MEINAVLKTYLSVVETEVFGSVYHVRDYRSNKEFGEKKRFLLYRLDDDTMPSGVIEDFRYSFNTEIPLGQFESLVDMAMKWGLSQESVDRDIVEIVIRNSPSNGLIDDVNGERTNASQFSKVIKRHQIPAKRGSFSYLNYIFCDKFPAQFKGKEELT